MYLFSNLLAPSTLIIFGIISHSSEILTTRVTQKCFYLCYMLFCSVKRIFWYKTQISMPWFKDFRDGKVPEANLFLKIHKNTVFWTYSGLLICWQCLNYNCVWLKRNGVEGRKKCECIGSLRCWFMWLSPHWSNDHICKELFVDSSVIYL